MRKLALSLGMREEGCRRKQLWLDGNWEDVIEYGILVDEFFDKAG
jgi:RimJ/RimL family protein N-acetyltransferase